MTWLEGLARLIDPYVKIIGVRFLSQILVES